MKQISLFLGITLLGVITGRITNLNPVETTFFPNFAAFALTIGLYGSVIGINLAAIRGQRRLVIGLITLAVPLQILATGLVMYLIYPVAISFLLAAAIDQIDPLSVNTLLQDKQKMSERAKALLRVWSAFDDPVTVLFGFLILLPIVTGRDGGLSVGDYLVGLLLNLVPAGLLWFIQLKTKWLQSRPGALLALLAILTFAFLTQSYLLAALAGLLLRPLPNEKFQPTIDVFYNIIIFVVGMAAASYGVDIRLGLLLAIVEFFVVQPITTLIVFNGTAGDLFRIAFSQQNGLTTLLMGIAFQSLGINVLPILLPAILFVNLFNLLVNRIYSWKEERGLIN